METFPFLLDRMTQHYKDIDQFSLSYISLMQSNKNANKPLLELVKLVLKFIFLEKARIAMKILKKFKK